MLCSEILSLESVTNVALNSVFNSRNYSTSILRHNRSDSLYTASDRHANITMSESTGNTTGPSGVYPTLSDTFKDSKLRPDYERFWQDNERVQQDIERLQQDNEKLQRDTQRFEKDSKRLRQDKERILLDIQRIQQDTKRLVQGGERLQQDSKRICKALRDEALRDGSTSASAGTSASAPTIQITYTSLSLSTL